MAAVSHGKHTTGCTKQENTQQQQQEHTKRVHLTSHTRAPASLNSSSSHTTVGRRTSTPAIEPHAPYSARKSSFSTVLDWRSFRHAGFPVFPPFLLFSRTDHFPSYNAKTTQPPRSRERGPAPSSDPSTTTRESNITFRGATRLCASIFLFVAAVVVDERNNNTTNNKRTIANRDRSTHVEALRATRTSADERGWMLACCARVLRMLFVDWHEMHRTRKNTP